MTDNDGFKDPNEILSGVFAPKQPTPYDIGMLQVKNHTGASRVMVSDNQMVHESLDHASSADFDVARQPSEGVLSTAMTPWGEKCAPSRINMDTRVWVEGYETTVRVAETMGYIRQNPATGLWQDASGQRTRDAAVERNAESSSKKAVGEQEQPKAEPLDDESEAFLGEGYGKAQGETLAVIHDIVFSPNNEPSPQKVELLAARLGIEPKEASRRVTRVWDAMSAEAERSIAKTTGAAPKDVLEWARENRTEALQEAAMQHVYTGIPNYSALAMEYTAELADIDPEAVLSAITGSGLKVRREGKHILITDPVYGELEYKSAVRAGLIKVSRNV